MPSFTLKGTTAPGFAPSYLGQQYINTALGIVYFAVGTASSADWKSAGGGVGDALTSGNLSQFAATTSAQLAGVLSDKTGWNTGALAVFNDNPTLTRAQIAMGTLTADTQGINLSAIYNNAGVTFGGLIKAVLTDTASNFNSLFLDLQKPAGTSVARIRKDGVIISESGLWAYGGGSGFLSSTSLRIGSSAGDISLSGSTLQIPSTTGFGIGNDCFLYRDAANTLALRNSTNAQTLNIYGTSATGNADYVRGSLKGSTTAFTIAAESGGNGSPNLDIILTPKGNGRVDARTSSGAGYFGNSAAYIGTWGGGSGVSVAAGAFYGWTASGGAQPGTIDLRINRSGSGICLLDNNAGSFDRLQYGGTTNSFPCHKRRGATLECRLADDSAIATFVGAMVIKAGAVSDADFTNPVDGCSGYDTTNNKHYIRNGGVWKSSAAYT